MLAKYCSMNDLETALKIVNKKYIDNIRLYEPRQSGRNIHFRLKTNNSKEPGVARGASGKRYGSACWHVHGDFFEALLKINSQAVVITKISTITADGGNWQDVNVGSRINPLYASDACDCNFSEELTGSSSSNEKDFIRLIKAMDMNKVEDLLSSWGWRHWKLILMHCDKKILPLYINNEKYIDIICKRLGKIRMAV